MTTFLRAEPRSTAYANRKSIGLDVLVHGEFERNDMVEYFGEHLDGFAFTRERLGAELWLALREAAGDLRRCVATGADDGGMVELCAAR